MVRWERSGLPCVGTASEVWEGRQAWPQPGVSVVRFGPPSLEAADLGWEILRDVGRGAGMEVARQL